MAPNNARMVKLAAMARALKKSKPAEGSAAEEAMETPAAEAQEQPEAYGR